MFIMVEAQKMLDKVLSLPKAERQHIAQVLFDNLADGSASEIELAWLEEARQRAAKFEKGEVEARDGHLVLNEIAAKLRVTSTK